jgi:hypothetical protein
MFLNPLYESYLHYHDPFFNQNIPKDGINMFDECTYHIFNIQTLNPIFNIQALNHKYEVLYPIDSFNVRCKTHLVGWNILEDIDHSFWVLIGHFSSPYAFVGWHVSVLSFRKVFLVMSPSCKTLDAFLYDKCHPN